jgi:hypothetical protein
MKEIEPTMQPVMIGYQNKIEDKWYVIGPYSRYVAEAISKIHNIIILEPKIKENIGEELWWELTRNK